jgi:hypothetical protein
MTTPSPSEFLTFYRRLATHPSIRASSLSSAARPTMAPLSSRGFSVSAARPAKPGLSADDGVKTDRYPDDQHATRKDPKEDVYSASVR